MSDINTPIKDLTEIERLVVGNSVNFFFNMISNQIYHIEHHEPRFLEELQKDEKVQQDYIILTNFRDTADHMCSLFSDTFKNISTEDIVDLSVPASALETFFHSIFSILSENYNEGWE